MLRLCGSKIAQLHELALRAQSDPDAIPVLHDLMIELEWPRHPLVMPLCLGMDLAPERPRYQQSAQREAWERQIQKGHDAANSAWDMYAGKHPSWARAVLASLLFGAWSLPMRSTPYPYATCSPWATVRALSLRMSRPSRDDRAARRRERELRVSAAKTRTDG